MKIRQSTYVQALELWNVCSGYFHKGYFATYNFSLYIFVS